MASTIVAVCDIMEQTKKVVFSMEATHRRHDISDKAWELIKPHTIGNKGTWGGNAHDTRLFINAVFFSYFNSVPRIEIPGVIALPIGVEWVG